jgi:hypothetical protein
VTLPQLIGSLFATFVLAVVLIFALAALVDWARVRLSLRHRGSKVHVISTGNNITNVRSMTESFGSNLTVKGDWNQSNATHGEAE